MKFLLLSCILAVATCAYGSVGDDLTDKEMFLRIIECAQKGILNGIPEIGLPSHEPLLISHNFSQQYTILNYNIELALENMVMEGIPWWNVTQMDEETVEPDTPVFDYTIYWKFINFEGFWRVEVTDIESGEQILEDHGDFGFELDHLTFSGLFNLTKPADDRDDGGFNELTLLFHAEETELHFEGLGFVSSLIKSLGQPALLEAVNSNALASVVGAGMRDKLNNDWIHKPERIQALITHCDDPINA